MSTAVDGIRHLARIVTIEETAECLKPSDRVHMARVGLWWVITSRDMKTGDKAVYFEVDSVLSHAHPAFNGLRGKTVETIVNGKTIIGVRLESIFMRGTLSQGLLVPLDAFDGLYEYNTQYDVDAYFDGIISKADPAETLSADAPEWAAPFPSFVRKTNCERIQNIPNSFLENINPKDVYATEKLDGSSTTIWRDIDGTLRFAKRNVAVKPGYENNPAHQNIISILKRYHEKFEQLKPGDYVQGELFNPAKHGSKDHTPDFRVYNASSDRVRNIFTDIWVPILDIEWPDDGEAALAQAADLDSVFGVVPAEGVVWWFRDGVPRLEIGQRECFKVISNRFLMRKK